MGRRGGTHLLGEPRAPLTPTRTRQGPAHLKQAEGGAAARGSTLGRGGIRNPQGKHADRVSEEMLAPPACCLWGAGFLVHCLSGVR